MPITKRQEQELSSNPGLCQSCQHCRIITSSHDSVFYLCQLGFSDPAFPKYPRLPVFTCSGFTPISLNADSRST